MKANWVAAVVVTVLFFLSQFVWGRVLGVDYQTITESTAHLWTGMVFRVGLTALIFTVMAVILDRRWQRGVFVQKARRLPGWMWGLPLLMVATSIARIADNDWSARGAEYMLVLGLGVLLVGIAEETTFRGIVVRALQGSTHNEFVVMLISSLLFGVIHAVNVLNGAAVGPTITQIGVATISGASLYITLRLAGNVFVPILLHALVDYSVLGSIGELGTVGTIAALVNVLTLLITIAAAIVILVSSMRAREHAA